MPWSLLRTPAFRALWVGRLFSWVGSGFAPLAIVFAAIDLGADAVDLGLVVVARSVPNIALVLVGGALADRFSKRTVAIASSWLSAASLVVAAALMLTQTETLPTLAAVGAVNGAAAAFFGPATSALLRETVPDDRLRDATVLSRVGMNVGLVIGTAVGGAVVATAGSGVALAVGAVVFVVAAAVFVGLPRDGARASGGTSVLEELGSGLGFVWRTRWLVSTAALAFTFQFAFAGGVQVVGPLVADQSFGRLLWGFAGALQTLGLIVGAYWAGALRGRLRLWAACLGAAALALPLVLLSFAYGTDPVVFDPLHWFFWISLGLFAASVGLEVFTVPLDVVVQRQVPGAYLGRVFSCLTLASLAGVPVGEVVVGPLTQVIGTPATLAALAGLVVAVAVAVALSSRVRRIDAGQEARVS
ncbi:MFS transporter [Frigoribacterium sp. CFBP 8759]|uniref:MFS transporter n=1 Tax=Frigoribacterium sp. CFBP 8759 TaxID=2775283 RepID=UPI0017871352|nr:MFS transporter [Frigoribacterium sp. CFBP 8759]